MKNGLSGDASLETELLLTKTVSHVVIMLHVPESMRFHAFCEVMGLMESGPAAL